MNKKYFLFLLFLICLLSINPISALNSDLEANTDTFELNEISSSQDSTLLLDNTKEISSNLENNLSSSDLNKDITEEIPNSKINTTLSTNSSKRTFYQANGLNYYAKLLDDKDNPLIGQNISFTISNGTFNKTYYSITDEKGSANVSIQLNPGTYKVNGFFNGTDTHYPSEFTKDLIVYSTIESNDLIVYTYKREPFVVNIFDNEGNYLPNATVIFNINNKNYTALTNYFGKAELIINLDPGNYIVKTTANKLTVENTITIIDNSLEITQENIHSYFDGNGFLKDEYHDSILIFKGDFRELGVLTINYPSLILGENARFYNTVFDLKSENITLSNISMFLNQSFEDNEYAGILIESSDITVSNNFINYSAPDDSTAFGIYSYGNLDEPLKNIEIINNTVIFSANGENAYYFNSNGRGNYYWGVVLSHTDNATFSNNEINCSLPLRNVNFYGEKPYGMISIDSVACVAAQSCENLLFSNNEIHAVVNSNNNSIPTLDAVIIHSCDKFILYNNTITEEDFITKKDSDNYLYGLDIYNSNDASVLSNRIYMNTTGGKDGAGTAYCIQTNGPLYNLTIAYNNLSTINNGPNLGIYSQNFYGSTDLIIMSNIINVTGRGGTNPYALVAGIEIQDTDDSVWNNTIEVHNTLNSTSGNVYGISYSQSTDGNHSYNIQYNTIITDSEYAVYLKAGPSRIVNSTIANNVLVTKVNEGNGAVKLGSGRNNIVINNTGFPNANNLPENLIPSRIINLNDLINALNSNGGGFSASTGTGKGVIDNGGTGIAGNGSGSGAVTTKGSGNGKSEGSHKIRTHFNGTGNIDHDGTGTNDNPTPGVSGESLSGTSSTAGSSGASAANAYELNKTGPNIASKSTESYSLALMLCIVTMFLIIIGYKLQKEDN